MSSQSRVQSKKNKLIGRTKQNIGRAVGNESLQAKGRIQANTGSVQGTTANVSGYAQGTVSQVSGALKGAVNALTGNSGGQMKNMAERQKGKAQKAYNY
ncbi:hypothetical protein BD770DRAFT_388649 [Pilaira anomala]|nr:hypothetical protein BD770DRAFT_388649 [Pilaira anomala]